MNKRLQVAFASMITAAAVVASAYEINKASAEPFSLGDPAADRVVSCLMDMIKAQAPEKYAEVKAYQDSARTPEEKGDFWYGLILEAQSLSDAGIIKDDSVMACLEDLHRKMREDEQRFLEEWEKTRPGAPQADPAAP